MSRQATRLWWIAMAGPRQLLTMGRRRAAPLLPLLMLAVAAAHVSHVCALSGLCTTAARGLPG